MSSEVCLVEWAVPIIPLFMCFEVVSSRPSEFGSIFDNSRSFFCLYVSVEASYPIGGYFDVLRSPNSEYHFRFAGTKLRLSKYSIFISLRANAVNINFIFLQSFALCTCFLHTSDLVCSEAINVSTHFCKVGKTDSLII
jgi:hypothetical protein